MWWTFAAACVASVTALLIAFVAYPWQKGRDRKLELHREKRAAYTQLLKDLAALNDMTWGEVPLPSPLPGKQDEMAAVIHLYASEEVLDAYYSEIEARHELMLLFSYEYSTTTPDDISRLSDDLAKAQAKLLRLMRYELTGNNTDITRMENYHAIHLFDHRVSDIGPEALKELIKRQRNPD